MSYLEQLLGGIELRWSTLGNSSDVEIANSGRKPVKASDRIPGDVPYYGANNIQDYVEGYTHEGSYILIAEDGTASIEKYSIQHAKGKFWANNHVHVICGSKNLITRFIYHYLKTINFVPFLSGGGRAKLTKGKLCLIPIPIPPLSVQKEIVRILDTFTGLTEELKTELIARKKQFTHYRDQLLSFEGQDVEWKTLGDVGNVRMCKRILKKQTNSSGDIPFYKIGTFGKEPDAYISRQLFEDFKQKYNYPTVGEVLISASGTIGRTVVFDGADSYFQDSNIVWIENDEKQVLNSYLNHFYKIAKWHTAKGGTISRLYNDNLKKTKIPVPSKQKQERIVAILDKFDTLTTSKTEGLPAEIEMRQKQYEYYRDLLLTFPKPKD